MSKWRLPTLHELCNAFDHETGKPKNSGFKSNYYVSSTTPIDDTNYVWVFGFFLGYALKTNKLVTNYVRCVKKKKSGKLKWSKPSKDKMTWSEACKYCERLNI